MSRGNLISKEEVEAKIASREFSMKKRDVVSIVFISFSKLKLNYKPNQTPNLFIKRYIFRITNRIMYQIFSSPNPNPNPNHASSIKPNPNHTDFSFL